MESLKDVALDVSNSVFVQVSANKTTHQLQAPSGKLIKTLQQPQAGGLMLK